jgi:hypothetical protein
MAHRTLDGVIYRGTFDPSTDEIRAANIHDPQSVAGCIDRVRHGLSTRFPEERENSREYRLYYAHLRIAGSIRTLNSTRESAVDHEAPPEFIALIDEVLAEAHRALAVAPVPSREPPPPPTPADWVRTPARKKASGE